MRIIHAMNEWDAWNPATTLRLFRALMLLQAGENNVIVTGIVSRE